MSSDSFDFSWMVGCSITSVRFNEPSQWVFAFEAPSDIGTESPWRVLKDGHVAVSSEDHLQQYGLPAPIDAALATTSMFESLVITFVEVREGTADLCIEFTDQVRLEIIPISSGYESWIVTTPTSFQVIAQGGGKLSGFKS